MKPTDRHETTLRIEDYSLHLGEPMDADRLRELAGPNWFRRGPIVFLTACHSGVVGVDNHHRLLAELRRLGARAVLVTETKIEAEQGPGAVAEILTDVLQGVPVGTAVLMARRRELSTTGQLSRFAFSYYGPPGLRLTHPVSSRPSEEPS